MSNNFSVYVDLLKVDAEKRMVYGYASTEALDKQNERVAKDALEKALPEYMRFANIREMHQPSAVGIAKEANIDEKGLYLGVKVVDDAAWNKVKEGVYKGFSIGGRRISKTGDTITALDLTEISLVDRPANPEATIELWKSEAAPQGTAAENTPAGTDAVDELAEILNKGEVTPAQVVALIKREQAEKAPTVVAADAPAPEVKKSLYDVAQLAAIVEGLKYLCQCVAGEAATEGDGSAVPAECHAALIACAKAFKLLAAEEADEAVAAAAPQVDVPVAMASQPEDLQKLEAAAAELSKRDAEIDTLRKRVHALEALPALTKGELRAISKEADGVALDAPQAEHDRLAKLSPEDRAREMIKKSHAQPFSGGDLIGLR